MSATVDSNGTVVLTGEGAGVNGGYKRLVAAPSTAVKMQFVFRAFFNSLPDSGNYTGAGWDNASFFGLGFDNTMYAMASSSDLLDPTGFFGILTREHPQEGGNYYPTIKVSDKYSGVGGSYGNWSWPAGFGGGSPLKTARHGFFNGIGGKLISLAGVSDNGTSTGMCTFTDGANATAITYGWEVFGSQSDNSVFARLVINDDSLAQGDAMFGAITDAVQGTSRGDYIQYTIHGDTTSAWRNAGSPGTMNFPRWLKMNFTLPSQTMNLTYWKIRYLDVNETVVREQEA